MIKLEFPADRTDIARALGKALLQLSGVEIPPVVMLKAMQEADSPTPPAPTAAIEVADADYPEPPADIADEHITDADYPEVPEPPRVGEAVADDLPDPAQIDHHGVPFDPEFCSSAKQPFYESGPMQGQWKKKRGIDEHVYTAWYGSHSADAPAGEAPAPDTDTAAAFSADAPPPPPAPGAPQTFGDLMAWVSAQTAAGHLSPENITAAWETAGLSMIDLVPPNDEATITERVAKLYAVLTSE